ncbi:MAG: hypothetical protein P8Y94_18315 [Acidobacteriota bacterium]
MKTKTIVLTSTCSLLAIGWLLAQEGKPDFSGTWKFDRDKSELRRPTFRMPGGGPSGGGGGDIGGMGGGMGGPGGGMGGGMGGPGMGGPGMPPGGMRGPGGFGGQGPGRGDPEMMGVARVMEIEQAGSRLIVREPMTFGTVATSKTKWKKTRLITESTSNGRMGATRTIEERSLSEDGQTMTIVSIMTSGFMHLKRTLVYEKVNPAPNGQ